MRLFINDVAVRDGFQIEKTFVPTADKIALVDALSRTGLAKIEVTSFVSAKAVPALADAKEVLAGIERVPGVAYVALVPNIRGAQEAASAPARPDELNGVMSASETHNRANINRTHAKSLEELPVMLKVAHEAGMKMTMSLSTTFGCPFEGRVDESAILRFVEAFREAGVDGISLADTTGMANPAQVERLTRLVLERFPAPDDTFYTLHFHNTRGMGLANVVAGIAAGVRSFDGSIAGLGGCPFAPGATGNICTEDMVNMLEDMGHDTGVDLARLIACARRVPALVGHDTPGQVMKAGPSLERHPSPL
ncbi:MAG TPA: hydroxymethylglutaryl-CoA lyase [Usitatibacteraceae bacterium]|jgi:hydroxymethylglutaryl-CoA lyase|nr:hydroxymethylglutaryl-CoA lyase [Usitatibacteraceae bacterium]